MVPHKVSSNVIRQLFCYYKIYILPEKLQNVHRFTATNAFEFFGNILNGFISLKNLFKDRFYINKKNTNVFLKDVY